MASVPAPSSESQSLLPRTSSADQSPVQQTHSERAPQSSPSATFGDSQPEILGSSKEESKSETTAPGQTTGDDEGEFLKCWICLQDENDSPGLEWRAPCPCNLRAHSECLLEWIADLEASPSRKPSAKILCPQCKSVIRVVRPRDYLVDVADVLRRTARILVLPAGFGAIIGILYSGSTVYGANVITLVFGALDGKKVLAQSQSSVFDGLSGERGLYIYRQFQRFAIPFLPPPISNWKIVIGLPLIAPILILARTGLADRFFSILPIAYFVSHHDSQFLLTWPPSPGSTFAFLPYIRAAYRELYHRSFKKLEKEWDRAVQRPPREGETAEQVAQGQAAEGLAGDIDIEVEILNIEIDANNPDGGQHHHRNQVPAGQQQVPDGQGLADQADAQPGVPGANEQWEYHQNTSVGQLASTIMGAMFFPAMSSLMGELLQATLPSKLVTRSVSIGLNNTRVVRTTGLLQEKWGRTLVGGCLFIVLKDALILYSKWRKAKTQGQRKILDYTKKRSK